MSFFATLKTWAVKRRRLLAGVVGVAVETAAAAVPGVNLAAKFLGEAVKDATQDLLDPDTKQPLPAEQLAQIDAWLQTLSTSYAGLLDRLEKVQLPDAGSFEQLTLAVKKAIEGSAQLAEQFDSCLVEVRQQTLSLSVMERKLDEHFHVQLRMQAGLEEIKRLFAHSPMASDWAAFRNARPDAVQAVARADELFLVGKREDAAAAILAHLKQRGVTDRTLAHLLGLVDLGRGQVVEARQRLEEAVAAAPDAAALAGATARISTLSGRAAGQSSWRSLPRGFALGRKYKVEAEIGRGGMASVYRAASTLAFAKEKTVAIKVPSPDLMADLSTRRRFEKEIEVSMRLSESRHPNVVRVNECELFDDPFNKRETYALVMELIDGISLQHFLANRRQKQQPLTVSEVHTVMVAVCAGLAHAHEQGVLHRDVKPHNVMVARGGVIKLMDFGIARVLEEGQESTKAGQVLGTLAYMPREMLAPDPSNRVCARTDVFMLGVLLRELLTFSPSGSIKSRSDCPDAWRALIKDATQDDQDDRPESVAVFAGRLREGKSGGTQAPRQPAPPTQPAPSSACPACGAKLLAGQISCMDCGFLLVSESTATAAKICPNPSCAVANPESESYCQRCTTPLPIAPGTVLHGRYKVKKQLATGGFGLIYLGEDTKTKREIAIKDMICTDPQEFAIRLNFFRREADVLRVLSQVNSVPRIYDFIEQGQSAQLVMEYIPGKDLLKILEENNNRPFGAEQVIEWSKQICDVLGCMHSHSPPLIYRDVKPDNFILLADGKTIKMIDFGTARDMGKTPQERRKAKTRIYTEGYSPPEQIIGKPEERSDLHALAATMYQLLTGKFPEGFYTAHEVESLLEQPGAIPQNLRWLYELIKINLAEDVEDRYHTAGEIKDDLQKRAVTREKACPGCGKVNKIRTPSCEQCKRALTTLRGCHHCGKMNPLGTRYCAHCDNRLR